MNHLLTRHFRRTAIAVAASLLAAPAAQALDFELAGTPVKLDTLITVGGLMRMQDRDSSLVGKSNLTPGLCVSRVNAELQPNKEDNEFAGDTCTTSNGTMVNTPSAANLRFVQAPGSYSPNGDNGNLNFDRHDIVSATAKMNLDLSFSLADFDFFVRGLYFFDAQYDDLIELHPDPTLIAARTAYPDVAKDVNASDAQVLDYFVSRAFTIADRNANLRIGRQVLNWGESSFLALNSFNVIAPPNQALLRVPGFDIKELFQPVGMVFGSLDLFEGVSLEAFYNYEWKPIEVDPVGSFFSVSDTLGAGGQYALLSFGKAPEDPGVPTDEPDRFPAGFEGLYSPRQNDNDPIQTIGSTASRTLYRDYAEENRRRPDDGGQYGAALKLFLENFNNGTELAFYFANYHSRVPSVSFFAAQNTCIPAPNANPLINLANIAQACELTPRADSPGDFDAGIEPLPLDTPRLFVEYPEDIRMYGLSFNTTIGDLAWSGEYVFRDNLPIQIHTTDLTFAALQPGFPVGDYNIAAAVLPGRRSAVPDFVSVYRNDPIDAGQYIQGFEQMKVGQVGTTFLQLIGGDNWVDASQITLLLEMGLTHVVDMPGLDELQFQGAGTDTHISGGADGTVGIEPGNPNPGDAATNSRAPGLRQNPTAHPDLDGFGSDLSYGYRFVALTRYDSVIGALNLELLNGFFHDVEGTAPGLGQNFVQGRKQILAGVRWDYLSTIVGELRYTWFTGGANRDPQRDRDNLLLFIGYQF
ncbi:MAG TPA: DUF1302 family protein [Nevskiaceae bacterium]|nr:DUF1302 family protein [Nevskiaceae bacterium]